MNTFEMAVEDQDADRVSLTDGDITLRLTDDERDVVAEASGDAFTVGIRPQHIGWSDEEPEEEIPSIAVRVNVVEMTGTEEVAHCRTDDENEIRASFDSGTVSEGDTGYLTLDPASLHIYDGHEENSPRLN
jgi:ABC-type sugar transport system ATPase subunit